MVVYLLFSRHISCAYFLHASIAIDFRRCRAQSTVRSIALHTHSTQCVECLYRVSRVDRVISIIYLL